MSSCSASRSAVRLGESTCLAKALISLGEDLHLTLANITGLLRVGASLESSTQLVNQSGILASSETCLENYYTESHSKISGVAMTLVLIFVLTLTLLLLFIAITNTYVGRSSILPVFSVILALFLYIVWMIWTPINLSQPPCSPDLAEEAYDAETTIRIQSAFCAY